MDVSESRVYKFQSRRGFSDRLDGSAGFRTTAVFDRFNPVVGFLTVSTKHYEEVPEERVRFNPVVGFLTVSTQANST